MTTPKLSMPELVVGQAGKELTHNQALAILDQLAQAVVIDKDLTAPPGSPANGAMYIVASGATGAWAGQDGKLAFWLTTVAAWTFVTPADGWRVWVIDEAASYGRQGGAWVLGGALGLGTAAYANLTTSSLDTTVGRVTKTGDAGWLNVGNGPVLVDLDATATIPSGSGRYSSGVTIGTVPTGAAANGEILVERFSATVVKETWTDVVGGSAINPRTWFRTSYAVNTWGQWQEIFVSGSIRLAYGVTPSAWPAGYSSIDLGDGALFSTASNFSGVTNNLYNDGTNWRYKKTSSAILFGMIGNLFNVATAPYGTAGAGATLTTTLGVDTAGNVVQQNPAGLLGYGTGAGGTVTQATNKATGVTLNKPCGQITMNAASLAASTAVSFTLTNSLIAATDNVTINIQSAAATGGTYLLQVDAVAAGSCRISLRNLTGGALADALVLNFQLNKAVIA